MDGFASSICIYNPTDIYMHGWLAGPSIPLSLLSGATRQEDKAQTGYSLPLFRHHTGGEGGDRARQGPRDVTSETRANPFGDWPSKPFRLACVILYYEPRIKVVTCSRGQGQKRQHWFGSGLSLRWLPRVGLFECHVLCADRALGTQKASAFMKHSVWLSTHIFSVN